MLRPERQGYALWGILSGDSENGKNPCVCCVLPRPPSSPPSPLLPSSPHPHHTGTSEAVTQGKGGFRPTPEPCPRAVGVRSRGTVRRAATCPRPLPGAEKERPCGGHILGPDGGTTSLLGPAAGIGHRPWPLSASLRPLHLVFPSRAFSSVVLAPTLFPGSTTHRSSTTAQCSGKGVCRAQPALGRGVQSGLGKATGARDREGPGRAGGSCQARGMGLGQTPNPKFAGYPDLMEGGSPSARSAATTAS